MVNSKKVDLELGKTGKVQQQMKIQLVQLEDCEGTQMKVLVDKNKEIAEVNKVHLQGVSSSTNAMTLHTVLRPTRTSLDSERL